MSGFNVKHASPLSRTQHYERKRLGVCWSVTVMTLRQQVFIAITENWPRPSAAA